MRYIFVLLFCFVSCSSFAEVRFDGLTYHFKMDYPKAKEVVLLFSFDNYTTKYHMERDDLDPGLFTLELEIPKVGGSLKPGKYYYRIIVDGVMTYDQSNPDKEISALAGVLSYFEIKKIYLDDLSGPVQIAPRTYRFFYHQDQQTPPQEVLLTSDYDSWNLYRHLLRVLEDNPKTWYVDIHFDYPGDVQYSFIVDGRWAPDWNNTKGLRNQAGQDLSILTVK